MLNIVQDSALLESIGAQTETVRLRSQLSSTDKKTKKTFYDARSSMMDWISRLLCFVVIGEYRWESHDSEESESQPHKQWH